MDVRAAVKLALDLTAQIRNDLAEQGQVAELALALDANAALTDLIQLLDPEWEG